METPGQLAVRKPGKVHRSSSFTINFVKKHFQKPEGIPVHTPNKVLSRTPVTYTTACKRDDVFWEHYRRREHGLSMGHFSDPHQPFRPLGEPETDSFQLVTKRMTDFLDSIKDINPTGRKFPKVPMMNQLGNMKAQKKEKEKKQALLIETDSGHRLGINEIRSLAREAGMDLLKVHIRESEDRITAVKGGEPYDEHVRKHQTKRLKEAELKSQQNNKANNMVVCKLSTDSALLEPLSQNITTTNKWGMHEGAEESSSKRILSLKTAKQKRKVDYLVEKLKTIYEILCAIHNMKMKYLRGKVILGKEILKSLKKPCTLTGDRRLSSRAGNRRTSHNNWQQSIASLTSSQHVKMDSSYRKFSIQRPDFTLPAISARGAADPPTPLSWFKRKATLIMTRNILSKDFANLRKLHAEVRVDTWDDLLQIGKSSPNTTRGVRQGKRQVDEKTLPLWHTLEKAVDKNNFISGRCTPTETKEDAEKPNAEETVQRCKLEFYKMKNDFRKQAAHTLERHEREKLVAFKYKFSAFEKLCQLHEQHLMQMAIAAADLARHPDVLSEEFVKWYEDLKQDAHDVIGNTNEEVEEWLRKIIYFAHEDMAALPLAKEKVCLLAMSFPAYEILNPQVQAGFKFVLEDILNCCPTMFSQWMKHRKLHMAI